MRHPYPSIVFRSIRSFVLKVFLLCCLTMLGASHALAFRVVGYFPSWQGNVSDIQFSKVTHINYAFLLPNSNGSLQAIDNASKLTSLVTAAHNAGVKVSISVGGWNNGDDSAFVSLAGNSSYRTTFVNNIVNFISQYNLDGVDIDWEYPDTSSESANYSTLMSQLSTAMHSRGKLLTSAVIAYGSTGDYIPDAVFGYVDWLNIMDYDNTNGTGQSTYASAITALDYWNSTRTLPASKTQLGVPFYSDPSDYAFWQLLQMGASPTSDSWNGEGYNGIPTIQNKVNLAFDRNIGGMMIWELSEDATGANSLLSAINTIVVQRSGGSLPSGWTDVDIGAVGQVGSASYSSGTFTVNGSGSDIWTAADQFNFAYRSTNGDVTLIAKVVSESGSQSYAKAGVMIRESLATNSIEASVLLTPTNGVSMEVRPTTGATTINLSGWVAGVQPPSWVKLVRSGSTFTGYSSADGTSWTQIASTNVTMASSTKAGLAVTAHSNSELNSATFSSVAVTNIAADFAIDATPSSQSVQVGDGTTYTATVTPSGGFSGTVTFSVSGLPTGATGTFSPTSVSGSGSSTLSVSTSGSTPSGSYTLTVSGTSGSLSHNDTVTLNVSDFTVSVTPASQTVAAGQSTNYTVNLGNNNAFTGTIGLSVAGLPAGASGTFNPASLTAPGSSTLTVTTTTNTPPGTSTLTVTGTSGSLSHNSTASLVVNASSGILYFEAENVAYTTNGATASVVADSAASGGNWVSLLSTNAGPWIEYTLPNIPAGTYDLTFFYKQHPNRAIHSLTVDGVKLGSDLDQYSATPSYVSKDFGVITFKSAGNHVIRLTATGKNASAGTPNISADAFQLAPASPAWQHQDIGAVGLAGSFSQNAGVYTVAGSGADIWTTADQFHYAYQAVSGDVTITARVASEQQTSSYCKAAVMLRASLATNSVEASVLLTPTNGVAMEVRPTTGAATINVTGWVTGAVPPSWVRLTRSGNTFTAFSSSNGTSWTQLGSTNVTMSAGVTAGLAVTSHDNTKLNTATFDNVTLP
jgi:regulation of enolase protein 1 (concanavalin A-like superfamily)